MKICYLANSRFPSERAHMTQIVQMCNAFASLGHSVTLLTTDRKTAITENPEEFFGVPFHFSVVRISVPDMAGWAPRIFPAFRPYAYMVQRIIFSYRAWRHIQHHAYTHLYGRDEWILYMFTYVAVCPIIWESHEARFTPIARVLLKAIHHIVVISEGIYDFYIAQGVSKEKIFVAHDAVDDRFFEGRIPTIQAREMLGMKPQKPVAMYIGGLEKYKGAVTFFEATKNQDAFEAYVVGGKENEIPSFREAYPHIHFLGPRPYRELARLQQAGDILVIPNTAKESLSAHYTSPLKLFAHMASQKPIVASRIPSITSVLADDEAFFFTADDPESLRDTIHTALTHPKEAHEKALRAHTKSFQYTWKKRAGEILNFLQKSH